MKLVHVTKTLAGGAGVAATRTVAALRAFGCDAELWSEGAAPLAGPRPGSFSRWLLDRFDSLPTRLHIKRRKFSSWSNNWRATHLAEMLNASADIVHLHWIGQGFLSLDDLLAVRKPIVWTMHDAWAFTGGCHYPNDCDRYRTGCGCCPQLGTQHENDLSFRNRKAKQAAAAHVARWISPSRWLADCAAASGLVRPGRVRVVPNALEQQEWLPQDRAIARRSLNLPDDALILAAGAFDLHEVRKGCHLLHAAVSHIAGKVSRRVVLLVFGGGVPGGKQPVNYVRHQLGTLRPYDMAQAFSSADALLLPSLQDNLPNIAVEAQACGCPIVGFASGGISEIVENGVTGLLTTQMSAESLAETFLAWLKIAPHREDIVRHCKTRHELRYTPDAHAATLLALYNELVAR